MLPRRAATLALGRSAPVLTRGFAAKPKIQVPVDREKVHETPIVQNCGGDFVRWMGPGSRFQMYCAILLSGSLVYQADASANMLEVLATSGAICSASATVFFGAKRLCDRVVTDIVTCRKMGNPDEFVRVSVMGVGVKEVLEASPKDFKLLGFDGEDAYSFALGGRQLQLDTSTGDCVNRKALDMLMQGRPLVIRKVKQGKKGLAQIEELRLGYVSAIVLFPGFKTLQVRRHDSCCWPIIADDCCRHSNKCPSCTGRLHDLNSKCIQ